MATRYIRKLRSKVKIDYDKNFVLLINRSNKNILIQVVEPLTKKTLVTFNSNNLEMGKTDKSKSVGQSVANWLKEKKIEKVVFNRNGYIYHGRIKAVADEIRANNIQI